MANKQKIVPQVDPQRGFSLWHIGQIYTGDDGTGRIVPNVGDLVYRPEIPAMVEVISVKNNFSEFNNPLEFNRTGVSATDGMIGNGGGHVSETYRLNVDTKPEIPECSFDSRLRVYDDAATHLKLFLGTDTTVNGEVVSAHYNNSGQLVSENIPFGPAFTGEDGRYIKVPLSGHLTRPIPRGARVTAVIYKDGVPRSECVLIARNTSNTRPFTGVNRIVDSISLKSIWLSPDEDNTLIIPVGVPTTDIRAKCVVSYIDGGQREYAIDGIRAALHGLTEFASTSPGERKPLTLSYYPTEGEEVRGGAEGLKRHKSVPAWMRSREADGAYSIKLFACPVWMGEANGYALRYYLINLDGNMCIDVTRYVYSADGSTFNPHGYGIAQKLAVKLNVGEAVALGNSFSHSQQFTVSLKTVPTASSSPWTIHYSAGLTYGAEERGVLSFTGTNHAQVNLRATSLSLDEWLNRYFYSLEPLRSVTDEETTRRPTHVDLIYRNKETGTEYTARHSVDKWSTEMALDTRITPVDGDTLLLRFIKETPTLDVILGMTSVNMRM